MNQKELTLLIEKMTLEEKLGQLTQIVGFLLEKDESEITGPMEEMGVPKSVQKYAGSVLGLSGAQKIKEIQKDYLEKSRLKIPLIFMADIIHGQRTIFPIPLAMGATWNPELIKTASEITAKEASVAGLHVTFSPMVDLVRDARWGRVMESTGEDKYLNQLFAEAFVKGYQGENLKEDTSRLAACVKHFIGYGAAEGGREYNTVNMSERRMWEDYLTAFETAIQAGVELVMTSFNTVDGIPSTGNQTLLKGVLREGLDFDKVIISDWSSVGELIAHGVASDEGEAAKRALESTVDIEMMTFTFLKEAGNLIENGLLEESLIDQAVMRVLELKDRLGLFDNPYRGADEKLEKEITLSKPHRDLARKVAEESIVLLKNDGDILPLNKASKLAVIGPFAEGENILGSWSWKGKIEEVEQLLPALKEYFGNENVDYARGVTLDESIEPIDFSIIRKSVEKSDVIIMTLGESAEMSGEAASRTDIRLPRKQVQLLEELAVLNKPIVTVLFNGRPLDLNEIDKFSDVIVEAWFPGTEGGPAITNILTGKVNPSGKLTMSFPEKVGQIPIYYNHFSTGRPLSTTVQDGYVSKYLDASNDPKYPFGYGLTYTSFEYSGLSLSSESFSDSNPLEVTVEVTNVGNLSGTETVQMYVRDLVGEVVRPVKELKQFQKINIEASESKTITFALTEEMVRYVHPDLTMRSDEGEFEVFVGSDSTTKYSKKVTLIK